MESPIILISIMLLVLVLLIVFVFINKKKRQPIDYYNLFIIGLIWAVIGIPTQNSALGIMGVAFLAAGLANRDKWEKNRRRWKDLSDKDKKAKIITLIILGLVFLAGLVVFYLTQQGLV